MLIPSPISSSGGISTYQIKPQIADQGIFCFCRSELYIVRLGQSGGEFNAYDLIQISDHTATTNASVSMTADKKALIFKCAQFENPIFIGRFWIFWIIILCTKNGINAPNTVFVTQDADEIRDSGIPGLYAFRVCGAGYLHDDIPSNDLYKYSFVLILYRNITSCHIILFPDGGEPVAVKSRVDQGWGGWRYLDYKL